MTGVFEQGVELERDDGVRLRALELVPDFDQAERCAGAGVVVVTGGGPRDTVLDALARPLAEHGFFVVALALGGEQAHAIDELAAALVGLRQLARGRLGVIAVDGAGPVALEAAACLPMIDAVVHASGGLPPLGPRLRRLRAAVLLLHAEHGGAIAEADLDHLVATLRPAHAPLVIARLPVTSGVFDHGATDDARGQAPIVWDRVRDFLVTTLT